MAICGICNTEPSKYKCPSCEIPYCSLVCYKPHKAEHEKSKAEQPAEPTSTLAEPETTEGKSNAQAEPIEADIFAPLLASHQVQEMLASPSLRRHLLNVHKATLEPPPGSTYRGRGRGRGRGGRGGLEQNQQHRPWNAEKGTRAGVGKLRRLRKDNIEVDEFVNVVMGLMEKDTSEGGE